MEGNPRRASRVPSARTLPIVSRLGAVSIAVLLLNDHVLKAAWPGLITGKLSDAAGLIVLPLLLASVVLLATRLVQHGFSEQRRTLVLRWSAVTSGIGFALVKTVEPATLAYEHVLGLLQWPARALLSVASDLPTPDPRPVELVADRSDLLVLPVLLLFSFSPTIQAPAGIRLSPRAGRLAAAALLTASSVALVATSPVQPPTAEIQDREEVPLSLRPGDGFLGLMTISVDDGAATDGSARPTASIYVSPAASKETPGTSQPAGVRMVVVPLDAGRQPLTTARGGGSNVQLESLSLNVGSGHLGCEQGQGRCLHRFLVDVSLEPGAPAFEGSLGAWVSARFEFRSAEPEASVSAPAGASVDIEIVPTAEAAESFRAGQSARLSGTEMLRGGGSAVIGVRSTLAGSSLTALEAGGVAVLRLQLGGSSDAFDEGVVATIRHELRAPPGSLESGREFGWSNEAGALLLFPFDGCPAAEACAVDLVIELEDASSSGSTRGSHEVPWSVEVLTYLPRAVPSAAAGRVQVTDLCAAEPAACLPPSPTPAPTPEPLRPSVAGILADAPRIEAGAMTFEFEDGRAWTVNVSAWRLYGPEPDAEPGVLLLSGRSPEGDWWAAFAPAAGRDGCFVITDRATFTPQQVTFDSRLTLLAGPDLEPDLAQPMPQPARAYCLDERGRVTGLLDPA